MWSDDVENINTVSNHALHIRQPFRGAIPPSPGTGAMLKAGIPGEGVWPAEPYQPRPLKSSSMRSFQSEAMGRQARTSAMVCDSTS